MSDIKIERDPDKGKIESMGILKWPIWEKEPSKFDWYYDSQETCYVLEGKAKVKPENGETVEFGAGDLVIFPEGMACVWDIADKIKKHYKFG